VTVPTLTAVNSDGEQGRGGLCVLSSLTVTF